MMAVEDASWTQDSLKPHPHDLVLVVLAMLSLLPAVKALLCVTAKWRQAMEHLGQRGMKCLGWWGTGQQGLGFAPHLCPCSPPFARCPLLPSTTPCSGDEGTARSPDRSATLSVSPLTVEEVADKQLCALKPPALFSAFRPPSASVLFPLASPDPLTVSPGPGYLGALLQPAVHLGEPGTKPGRRWWKLWRKSDSHLDAPDPPGSSASLAGGPAASVAPCPTCPWTRYAPGIPQQMLPFPERLPCPRPEGCALGKVASPLPGAANALGSAYWLNWSTLKSRPSPGISERDKQRLPAARGSHFPTSPYLLCMDPSMGNIQSPQPPPTTASNLPLPGVSQEPPSPLQNWETPSTCDEFVEIALDESLPAALSETRACSAILEPLMGFWTRFLPSFSLNCLGKRQQDPDPREKNGDETLSIAPKVGVKLEAPGTDVWGKILTLSCTRHSPLIWGKAFMDLLFHELFDPTTMAVPRVPTTQSQADPPSEAALGLWNETQDPF
ncbi:uncharacterized protein [Narcine bancroftii]|uniref:uncharacterized protein n=1 Tax=Narcine bancroftii TaxID=1343680 RepID=UPI003831A438